MTNKKDFNSDVSVSKTYVDITNLWTRAVQIILVIMFVFTVVSFVGMYLIPMLGITVMGNMSEAQAANMFEIVRMWAFPMLFITVLLCALVIFVSLWFYRKSACIMDKVREKLIGLHHRSLERKQAVQINKKHKE